MNTLKEVLIELDACKEVKDWASNKTIEQVITECHRGDWMLWLGERIKIPLKELTLAKGHCAATVLHLMKNDHSRRAVQAAIDFGEGNITKDELTAAAAAAYVVAYAAGNAAYAAYAAAAYDAAYAAAAAYAGYADAYAAADAGYADAAAAAAAYVAGNAAYAAAYAAAEKTNQLKTADICRKYIGKLIIAQINENYI